LILLASRIINKCIFPLTSEKRVNVLILDDSLFSRNRSKAVELLAKVFDHVTHKYVKGFRMLTLGWSDGNSFIPLAFSLLSSSNEKNRLCGFNAKIDKRSNGYKRRLEAVKKSTEAMFDLLDTACRHDIPADYVLFDNWFAFPETIRKVLRYNLNTICMLKALPKVFYTYQNKKMNLEKLYSVVKKKSLKSGILASIIVTIGTDENNKPIRAKIVFIKDRNSRGWLALLSTDTTLSDEEIIRIYGKRWNIEVFFKMSKSFLKLSKEFQGRSYDMMIAHTTIVFVRYIMLAAENRINEDDRTIGELFYLFCDELKDIEFFQSIQLILDLLKDALKKQLILTEKKINQFLNNFIQSLPALIKSRLEFSMCES